MIAMTARARSTKPKRVLDIEAALSWAYRHELPKGSRPGSLDPDIEGPPLPPSALLRFMSLGTRIDSFSSQHRLSAHDPHADALNLGS